MRSAFKKTYIKKIRKQTVTSKGVSIDRVEHSFNTVLSHLRQVGTYKQTLAKHNVIVYTVAFEDASNTEPQARLTSPLNLSISGNTTTQTTS